MFASLLLLSGVAQANVQLPSQWSSDTTSRSLPLSSSLQGTGAGASDGEDRFRQLAGDDYANIAANNPYVFYASMLGTPDTTASRQSNNVLVASSTAGQAPQVAPPPVPLPPAVYLLISGLVALYATLKPRRRVRS